MSGSYSSILYYSIHNMLSIDNNVVLTFLVNYNALIIKFNMFIKFIVDH